MKASRLISPAPPKSRYSVPISRDASPIASSGADSGRESPRVGHDERDGGAARRTRRRPAPSRRLTSLR